MNRRMAAVGLPLLAGLATVAYAKHFKDVPRNSWAYESVDRVSDLGLMGATASGKFEGNKAMTVGEIIVGMDKVAEKYDLRRPERAKKVPKREIPRHFAADNLADLVERGIVPLTIAKERRHSLDAPASRILTAMLVAHLLDKDAEAEPKMKDFTDIKTRDHQKYAKIAHNTRLVKGYPNGTYKPDKTITRYEAATVLDRLLDLGAKIQR